MGVLIGLVQFSPQGTKINSITPHEEDKLMISLMATTTSNNSSLIQRERRIPIAADF